MPEGERILSQQEVDALLRSIGTPEAPAGGGNPAAEVTPLDFRHPRRLPRPDLQTIQSIHEPFARALRDVLGPVLRATVEAQLAGAEETTLSEFAESAPDPTALVIAAAETDDLVLLLEISPSVAFPVVEKLLGAGGPPAEPPGRPLREMEWGLLERVIDRLLARLAGCWEPAGRAVRLSLRARETNPAAVRGMFPEEVVRLGFLVESEGRRGEVNVCLPVPFARRLAERRAAESRGAAAPQRAAAVAVAEVDLAVRLPAEKMLLGDVEELAPGDVLITGQGKEGSVVVEIGGAPALAGRAGSLEGKRAALVEGRIREPGTGAAGRIERRGAERRRAEKDWSRLLAIPVTLSAVVAERPMPLREVLELRPGEVIPLGRGPGEPVELRIGDRPFATGTAVEAGERLGVRIDALRHRRQD